MTITGHTVESLRAFEQDIADLFNNGKIRAPVHLSDGNEAQLIEIFKNIREQDWLATTWRSHYHCLLKGVAPDRLRADILRGRSITLNYPDHRILSSAIVGGALPIALGIACAIKRRGEDARVWAFLGDMAAHSGIFSECARYADRYGLPIHFIVEDNGRSVCTPTRVIWGDGMCAAPLRNVTWYRYDLSWPHAGAGRRVEF